MTNRVCYIILYAYLLPCNYLIICLWLILMEGGLDRKLNFTNNMIMKIQHPPKCCWKYATGDTVNRYGKFVLAAEPVRPVGFVARALNKKIKINTRCPAFR